MRRFLTPAPHEACQILRRSDQKGSALAIPLCPSSLTKLTNIRRCGYLLGTCADAGRNGFTSERFSFRCELFGACTPKAPRDQCHRAFATVRAPHYDGVQSTCAGNFMYGYSDGKEGHRTNWLGDDGFRCFRNDQQDTTRVSNAIDFKVPHRLSVAISGEKNDTVTEGSAQTIQLPTQSLPPSPSSSPPPQARRTIVPPFSPLPALPKPSPSTTCNMQTVLINEAT